MSAPPAGSAGAAAARRIGFITPSSNTVVEPVATAIARDCPGVSVHFARSRVVQISLGDEASEQFQRDNLLAAAALLADARADVVAWNGTAASWLGFEADERLCQAIAERHGIAATTSVLAINEVLRARRIDRIGLVTPYVAAVQERIVANYRDAGIECVAERHLEQTDNYGFAEVSPGQITSMVAEVAAAPERPQAVVLMCTNLAGAPLVERLEGDHDCLVLDSAAVTVWKTLALAGVEVGGINGWGRLFREPLSEAAASRRGP